VRCSHYGLVLKVKHHGLHGCQFLPLVNQYTVFMQLHDKTICVVTVVYSEYKSLEIMFQDNIMLR